MTALTTRDALAKALLPHAWDYPDSFCDCGHYVTGIGSYMLHLAEELLASGAVVDAASLADDNALIERLSRGRTARHTTRSLLRALATALSERSPR